MFNKPELPETDALHHTGNIKKMLEVVISHVRGDVEKVDDPRAQVLFETTAEVLEGLTTAYAHYEEGKETAFRRASSPNTTAAPWEKSRGQAKSQEKSASTLKGSMLKGSTLRDDESVSDNTPAEAAQARAEPPAPEVAAFDA